MKKFYEIAKYGVLNIDKIFFESYFPIIFTCINELGQLFFVVCCKNNNEGCKWLIGKTEPEKIVLLLKNQITIRNVLLDSSDKFSLDYKNNEYIINYSEDDFKDSSIYLPKKDSFLYPDEGEFDEEINYYLMKQNIEYKNEAYENLIDHIQSIVMDKGTVIEEINNVKTNIEKIFDHSEITKTLVEVNALYLTPVVSNKFNEEYGDLKSYSERTMINNIISIDYNFYDNINVAA